LAQRIAAVRLDPTGERPFRADQNVAAADALETLGIRLFPSLSPRCFSLLSRSGDGRRRAAVSGEKQSGLWRRRWPSRRRACSPTGEHAAVERPSRDAFLAEPGEPFLGRARALGSVSPPAPAKKPVRFFFFRAGEGSSDEP